jgi:hypothetical protein
MARVNQNVVCLFGGVSSHELAKQLGDTPNFLSDFYFLNISTFQQKIPLISHLDEAYWSTPSSGGYAPTAKIGFAMSSNELEVGS